ncbi:MAG: porin [Rubrivivax sp.]|jgi:predicted porin|nr:porin [Rubrivivax sp.]
MKKTLIALAAIAATSAFAQSTVTMYGNVDVGYGTHKTESRDGRVFTKTAGVMDGSWAGSRLGFRGTEDLGGGLRASFTLEQGINPTSPEAFNQRVASGGHQIVGSSTMSTGNNRQSFLGLAGRFGEVRVGYQYTNSYDLVAFQGYSLSEFQGGNYQNQTHANGTRANAITYISPAMSGVTLKVQFGQGAGRGTVESNAVAGGNGFTKNNNDYMSWMAAYAKGPLSVAYAYSRADVEQANAVGATVINAFGVVGTAAATAIANTASRDQVSSNLGVRYNLGFATVSATFGRLDNGGSATTTTATKTSAQQFSVKVPFGATDLLLSTGSAEAKLGGVVTGVDSSGTMLGVSHALSKRTNVYAYTGREKNDAVTGNAAGYKDTKTMVGVRHHF